jgi:hypothetical protein
MTFLFIYGIINLSLQTLVVKGQFGLESSCLMSNADDMTDPQPKSGPSFIVAGVTLSNEI